MYQDTTGIMDRIHRVNRELIRDFDRIASRHGISYFLAAGSLLGAIRHRDFIPWDNDVDVSMLRSEFEKLVPHLRSELDPEKYELVLPDDFGKKYRDMVPYIAYKKARIRLDPAFDAFYEGKASRMTLDFFLFDRVPDDFRGKILVRRLEFLYGLANAHRYRIDYSGYPGLLKPAAFILKTVGKLIPAGALRKRIAKVAAKYDRNEAVDTISITNDLMSSFTYRFPISWYEDGRREAFAGSFYPVPKEAEKALSLHFGDYMTLPPEDKQVPHLSILGTIGDDTITEDSYLFED